MVCPACTVVVGSGVGLLRAWNVDDAITGLWLGALIVSSSIWLITWLNSKKIKFPFKRIIVYLSMYFLFLFPLRFIDFYGYSERILGVERVMFGVILGTTVFFSAAISEQKLRDLNEGKVLFPYQKVAVPVVFLTASSIIVYLLTIILG